MSEEKKGEKDSHSRPQFLRVHFSHSLFCFLIICEIKKVLDADANTDFYECCLSTHSTEYSYSLRFLPFSPNTSSSSSSPVERNFWPREDDSEDQERQSYARRIKRSRSCMSKSKRRRSPGTSKSETQGVDEFMSVKGSSSRHKKGPCYDGSLQGHSWSCTDEMTPCSCSDSDHNRTACRHSSNECPYTAGSPISIPGRKAKKRKRWSSNSDSSCESKHLSPRELSSDEMSDLEPQFIPKLTNDSMELTEDEQFRNVILQFSESCLEEEVSTLLNYN